MLLSTPHEGEKKHMATSNPTSTTKPVREANEVVRDQAETSARGAQRVFETYVDVTMASIKRSQELAEKSYRAWTDSLSGGNLPTFGIPTTDVREIVSAGFDFAQGVLDAQREIANQLVDAFAPARS
jgi:hypothetical protein